MTKTTVILGQTFILHPTGSVFWKEKSMLLISDVHLGKIAHFRRHGVAVPQHSALKNFEQLDKAVAYFNPRSIVFLGDLFHSKMNSEWDLFAEWILKTDAKIILVVGNHDVINPIHFEDLQVTVCHELQIQDFLLTHHPEERDGFFNFSGHLHPGIELRGMGRQSLKLPCFFQKPNQMILPAFGQFTGKYFLIPTEHDCVYAITKEEVVLIC